MAPVYLLLLFIFLHQPLSSSLSESGALLLLKSSFLNPDPALSSWSVPTFPASDDAAASPCSSAWTGVRCFQGIVTSLRLGGLGLAGTIDVGALSHLRALRSISFINNNLSGALPDVGRLKALKSIYLSNNRFSGPINDSLFFSMNHLKKLWLDGNALTGTIPSSLSNATALIELRLEGNNFTGTIPTLRLPSLRSFNVSNNNLQGSIPSAFTRFDASAFTGNAKLCGPPPNGPPCSILNAKTAAHRPSPATSSNNGHVVLLIVGTLLLFLALIVGFAAVKTRGRIEYAESIMNRRDAAEVAEAMKAAAEASPVHLPASASSDSRGKQQHSSVTSKGGRSSRRNSGGGGPELVIVNEEKGVFGLPDLMRAAAEVLGNGGLGSVYKAVMDNGLAVAVKRMRELNQLNKEVFDGEMRRLGGLRHPNVLAPLAYHFRKEEKLVVSEYIPKGSLLYILHGDRGADHAAVDWPARLKIIRGIARAMAYLHAELASYELPHGNLKTGNVLLTPDFEPLVADYGFSAFANSAAAANALFAYKSPEAPHVSAKSDVFCFGVVVLEILTGKFPSLYLNNTNGGTDVVLWAASAVANRCEADLVDPQITGRSAAASSELIHLLRLAVACTQAVPDERPGMKEAADIAEKITAAATEGGVDVVEEVGYVSTWRDGYRQLSGTSRGSGAGRLEVSGKASPAATSLWRGDFLSP